jgi:hypothetical protein
MPKSLSILSLTLLMLLAARVRANPTDSPADWKAYFGLDTAQQKRFAQAEKARAAQVKPVRDQEKPRIESLKQQVESKASDAQIGPAFAEIRAGRKTIKAADEAFLDAIAAFLTPTQQAKWILKNHKPKNAAGEPPAVKPPPPPQDSAQKQAAKAASEAWKQAFALTPDQKQKFDAANKSKNETMKGLQAAKESALEQLSARVEAKAPDADMQSAVGTARRALAAIPVAEDAYWDGLAAFLSPTQQAKLFLKGK